MIPKKRTCDRCRALKLSAGALPECALGYMVDPDGPFPVESCEKPLTYLGLIEARKDMAYRENNHASLPAFSLE